jgi:tetratricopeptide (TPR) repeat protein
MSGTGRLNEIGEDLYRRGELEQALRAFEEAVKIIPSSARAHSNLATVYWSLNDHPRAFEHIEQAYAIEPENKRVLLNCIEINAAMSRQDRALNICQQYLLRHPGDSDIVSLMERLSGKTHDCAQAISQPLESAAAGPYIERQVSNRASLINYCIERFAYEKYLEIGCHENETFDQIEIPYKVGIDPVKGGTIRLTSDEFFRLSDDTFDVIFIDGLHYCEQVYKDVRNALLRLRKNLAW